MDRDKLKRILSQREGPKLDYKLLMPLVTETHKKEIAKDVIALANTSGGRGYIVIGVRDKTREVVGVDPEDYPEEKIQQIVQNRSEPPIAISVEHLELEGKWLVIVTVYKSASRPHQMRQTGAFYIRRGSTTDFAHRDEIASMMQQGGIVIPEAMPVRQARLLDLDQDAINRYLIDMTGEAYNNKDYHMLMQLGLIYHDSEDNRHYPTVGALVMFGLDPQRFLPHTGIKCIVVDALGVRSQYFYRGPLLSLLDQAMTLLEPLCDQYQYPKVLFEECLCNALIHRDYCDSTREITVFISEKRVEITNPGSMSESENPHHVMRAISPKRRNAWLYAQALRFDSQGRFTRYGLGLLKIKKVAEGFGTVRYVNLGRSNIFKVVLPGLIAFKTQKALK